MTKAVLIPIKEPARVKTRLSQLLTLTERQQLVWAMFTDVCRAVAKTTKADVVFIVTSFDKAVEHAQALSFDVLIESEQQSESASVDWAARQLREHGFDAMMRLPADVPLVRSEDIDGLLNIELPTPAALLVPSLEGTGTNCIIRTPADLFPSRFGPNSLALHKEEARRVGVECLVVTSERIALDIDEPQDIAMFLQRGQGTASYQLLEEIQITERLNHFLQTAGQ